ncbi:MAG: DUF4142 domain-containing protein [Telluria sp.]
MRTIIQSGAAAAALLLSLTASASGLDPKDSDYMKKSAQGLLAEVAMGKMAQAQASDQEVKQFGQRMVADHGKDLQKLRHLARRKNVTLPDSPDKDQTEEAGKLAKLSGAEFDREYVRYEAQDHKDDVEENGKTMKKASDAGVRKFASAEYRTVSAHKKAIDQLHARLGK